VIAERATRSAKRWYALDPSEVARDLAVETDSGLTSSEAAARLAWEAGKSAARRRLSNR
jgi:hypothetical protein